MDSLDRMLLHPPKSQGAPFCEGEQRAWRTGPKDPMWSPAEPEIKIIQEMTGCSSVAATRLVDRLPCIQRAKQKGPSAVAERFAIVEPLTISEPSATFSEPSATFSEPSATFSEPSATFSEPSATFSEPSATLNLPDNDANVAMQAPEHEDLLLQLVPPSSSMECGEMAAGWVSQYDGGRCEVDDLSQRYQFYHQHILQEIGSGRMDRTTLPDLVAKLTVMLHASSLSSYRLVSQNNTLNDAIRHIGCYANILNAALSQLEEEKTQLTEKNTVLQQPLNEPQENEEGSDEQAVNVEEQLRVEISQVKKKLHEINQLIKDKEETIKQLRTQLQDFEEKNRSVNMHLDESEQKNLSLCNELEQCKKKCDGLDCELTSKLAAISLLQEQNKQLTEKNRVLNQEKQVLNGPQENEEKIEEQLREEVSQLRHQLHEISELIKEKDGAIDQLKSELQDLDEKKRSMNMHVEQSAKKNISLSNELEQSKSKCDKLGQELTGKLLQVSFLQEQLEQLKEENTILQLGMKENCQSNIPQENEDKQYENESQAEEKTLNSENEQDINLVEINRKLAVESALIRRLWEPVLSIEITRVVSGTGCLQKTSENLESLFDMAEQQGIPATYVTLGYSIREKNGMPVKIKSKDDLLPCDLSYIKEEEVLGNIANDFAGGNRGMVRNYWYQSAFLEAFYATDFFSSWYSGSHHEVCRKLAGVNQVIAGEVTEIEQGLYSKKERRDLRAWRIAQNREEKAKFFTPRHWQPEAWLSQLAQKLRDEPGSKLLQLVGLWADFSLLITRKKDSFPGKMAFDWRKLGEPDSDNGGKPAGSGSKKRKAFQSQTALCKHPKQV